MPDDPTTIAEDSPGTDPVGAPSLAGTLADTAAVFGQRQALSREGRALAAELARILTGKSEITPDRKDWRFADPAWSANPVYLLVAQSYLAGCGFLDAMVAERGKRGRPTYTTRFLLDIISSAAPLTPISMQLIRPHPWPIHDSCLADLPRSAGRPRAGSPAVVVPISLP